MPVIIEANCFDPVTIMESGQCFRIVPVDTDTVEAIAFGHRTCITALGDNRFAFDCTPAEMASIWRPYFDLDTDYNAIINAAPKSDIFLQQSIAHAHGMRILRQDPWETLCGFIISQRKHIKAIRACMEALSNTFGEPVEGTQRKSFPEPARLAAAPESEIRQCGLGYRAPYLLDAATKITQGTLVLTALASATDEALLQALLSINGVGIKVADCVMLFGFRRLSRAPVDVWIRRVIDDKYDGTSPFEGYGEYAGIYQQYMFMSRRDEGR